MAANEATNRASYRCMVQEDSNTAPELSCYSPPSSFSKLKVDRGLSDASSGPALSPPCFMHVNWNSSYSGPSVDAKWWRLLQPDYGNRKDSSNQQLNAFETELESLRNEKLNLKNIGSPFVCEQNNRPMVINNKTGFSLDPHERVSTTCLKNGLEVKVEEWKALNNNKKQWPLKHEDIEENWYQDNDRVDLDSIDGVTPKQDCDLESPRTGSAKIEPWWRKVDKDELANLVAQKSLEHIENCDLPSLRSTNLRRGQFSCLKNFDQNGVLSSSPVLKPNTSVHNGNPSHGIGENEHSLCGSDKLFSKDSTEIRQTSTEKTSKAQLLEALVHSQTRAREAEQVSQQAFSEIEHILKLFFDQASHLFAHKHWLQLLQFEIICLQLKNRDRSPVILPRMPNKGKRVKQKLEKGKRGLSRYGLCKYAVAVAVGLGLVGAGLLLGWTMGGGYQSFKLVQVSHRHSKMVKGSS